MEAARKDVQESVTVEKASISVRFSRARAALDTEEKAALEQAEQKVHEQLSQIDKNIAHYQREIRELQAAATRLQVLVQERDSLAFLQGHLEAKRRYRRLSLMTSHTTTTSMVTETPLSAPSQEDVASLRDMDGTFVKLMYGRSPTLDTNSAHKCLQISSDLRKMTMVRASQACPHHPHRFDRCVQALCCESFSSGKHYWEVDVGGTWEYRVGVAYETIPRKGSGDAQLLGGSDASWSLEKCDDRFSVVHGGVKTSLSVRGAPYPHRIGLYLHWEGGFLAFYRADSMEVIHYILHSFSQPLYPGLGGGRYCNQPLEIVDLSRAS
ncbi:tripartite motif-containing protein 14-like [Lampetra planeri]